MLLGRLSYNNGMSSRNHETSFLETTRTVADRTAGLFRRLRGETAEPVFDYISLFPGDETEFQEMNRQAQTFGKVVFDKNGPVYRLTQSDAGSLPTRIVRVRNPQPGERLIGCADFVVDDYIETRNGLARSDRYREIHKEGYDIIEVANPELGVSVYFPSMRMTEKLMGLRT